MTAPRPGRGTWSIVAQSVVAALLLYVIAGTVETGLIGVFRPSERELAWVSDVVLASAFGAAFYRWRHLSVTRRALMDRERAELVPNAQLAVAADLQRRLLPTLPPAGHGIEWAAALQPAGEIGGDFYDLTGTPRVAGRAARGGVPRSPGPQVPKSLFPTSYALFPALTHSSSNRSRVTKDFCVPTLAVERAA